MRRLPSQTGPMVEALEPRVMLAGDHASLPDFALATRVVMQDNFAIETSIGQATGVIGALGDDDLFRLVAPYSGRTAFAVAQNVVGGLAPAIQLYDSSGNPMSVLTDGSNGIAAVQPIPVDTITAGETYYISVRAGTPSDTNEPEVTGAYTLVIVMEIPPGGSNEPGGNNPILLELDEATGAAQQHGFIVDDEDQDLFVFETLAPGEVTIRVTTAGSDLNAGLEILDEQGLNVIASGMLFDGVVEVAMDSVAGQRYLVRVGASPFAAPWEQQGAYTIDVVGAAADGDAESPTDERLTDGEMAAAAPLGVDLMTGLAGVLGSLTSVADHDVFTFRAPRSGMASVALERTGDGTLGTTLDVFRDQNTRMALDAVGGPAWLGRVTFEVVEGERYYIRVRHREGDTGTYTLRAASPLEEYVLMYPEGYSSATIDEYVPLVNPNPFPVSYTVTARYEVGERDQVIATGVIAASSRGGVTITSRRAPGEWLVRLDTPYALEVRSDAPLGATMSHYDFGVTTGESFTTRVSTEWTFTEARRDATRWREFLVFYNPNPSATTVRVSLFYDDGEAVTFTRSLDALRRGGVNFTTDDAVVRDGVFSVLVESDQPIVAALSSYDIVDQRGFGLLGDADAGSTRGAIPLLTGTHGAETRLSVFNPSGAAATVRFSTTMVGIQTSTIVREFVIDGAARRTISAAELGLDADHLAGLEYTSDVPVTVSSSEYHTGDGDATGSASEAVNRSIIADAFVNPAGAGTTYRELLSVHNPWETPTEVVVTLLRDGGVLDSLTVSVAARGFSFVRVDQMPGVLAQTSPVAFSIRIDGAAPVVASFMHYDLFLDGGWGTLAAPLGLPTALGSL